jgi:hypothetical protein
VALKLQRENGYQLLVPVRRNEPKARGIRSVRCQMGAIPAGEVVEPGIRYRFGERHPLASEVFQPLRPTICAEKRTFLFLDSGSNEMLPERPGEARGPRHSPHRNIALAQIFNAKNLNMPFARRYLSWIRRYDK